MGTTKVIHDVKGNPPHLPSTLAKEPLLDAVLIKIFTGKFKVSFLGKILSPLTSSMTSSMTLDMTIVLQVSRQEAKTSSKYPNKGSPFFTHF